MMFETTHRTNHPQPLRLLSFATIALALLTLPAATWADEPVEKERTRIVVRNIDLENCPQWHRGSFLGVELTALTPELRDHFGAPRGEGVMISRVIEDSAAAAAGLQVGDIVTGIAGERVASASELGRLVRRQEAGTLVEIEYIRDGRLSSTAATLEEKERCAIDIGHYLEGIDWEEIGRISEEALEGVDWQAITGETLEISNEAIEQALEGLHEAFENKDWQIQLERLEDIEIEGLEERMEELQERLRELEQRIEEEAETIEREGDQARLEMERVREEIERAHGEHREQIATELAETH